MRIPVGHFVAPFLAGSYCVTRPGNTPNMSLPAWLFTVAARYHWFKDVVTVCVQHFGHFLNLFAPPKFSPSMMCQSLPDLVDPKAEGKLSSSMD